VSELSPGWFKDPADQTSQRYWDGEGWLGDPLPVDVTPPVGPPPGAVPVVWPPPRPKPPAPASAPPVSAPPVSAPPVSAPPVAAGQVWPPPPQVAPARWAPGARLVLATPRPYGLPVAPLGLRCLARLIDFAVVLGLNVVGNGWLVYLYLSDVWPIVQKLEQQMLLPNPNYAVVPAVPSRASWILTTIPIVAMALWFAYEVPAIAQRGQTLGKRAVGIKVLPLEGSGVPIPPGATGRRLPRGAARQPVPPGAGSPAPPGAAGYLPWPDSTGQFPGPDAAQPLGYLRSIRRWNPLGLPILLWTCGLGFVLQLIDALSPLFGGPLHLALHDRSAGTVVVHSGRKGHELPPVKIPGELP
jgi:uncharacterized RDD family membrane protein YckC